MTLYELLLFVHVLAAATWVGGAAMLKVQSARALRSDPDRAAELALETERMGTTVLMPASIVLLVAGVWLVFEGDWGFERCGSRRGSASTSCPPSPGLSSSAPSTSRWAACGRSGGRATPR